MRYIIVIFLSVLFLLSCDKQFNLNHDLISKEDAIYIANELNDDEFNIHLSNIEIFILDENEIIYQVYFYEIKNLYENSYKNLYSNLYLFIYDVLNQKLRLKKNDFNSNSKSCNLDKEIKKTYSKGGINCLLNIYCKKTNNDIFILKNSKITQCEKYTISYYFFINSYFIHHDDYSGKDSFHYQSIRSVL